MSFLDQHKLRQQIYLSLNPKEVAKAQQHEIIINEAACSDEILNDIQQYFVKEQKKVIYPAKSYCVAIIYALLLKKYFALEIIDTLKDDQLFLGTDKYFRPYALSCDIYQQALDFLQKNSLIDVEKSSLSQVVATVKCFHAEFYTSCKTIDEIDTLATFCPSK